MIWEVEIVRFCNQVKIRLTVRYCSKYYEESCKDFKEGINTNTLISEEWMDQREKNEEGDKTI